LLATLYRALEAPIAMSTLRQEFEQYLAKKGEYLARYAGKVIVLKDGALLGVYADRRTALLETSKEHVLGTFLVQSVVPDDEQVRVHSRYILPVTT